MRYFLFHFLLLYSTFNNLFLFLFQISFAFLFSTFSSPYVVTSLLIYIMKSISSKILLILFLTNHSVCTIRIGWISNATFKASNTSMIYPILTCKECTCAALLLSAVGWNCMINNSTCQLIKNYSLNDIGLRGSIDETFFFQQLPFKQLTTHEIVPYTTSQTNIETASKAMTTQNLMKSSCDDGLLVNTWTSCTGTISTMWSRYTTLKFIFQTNINYNWYLDDVSVRRYSSEMLENGDFESISPFFEWTTDYSGSCQNGFTISTNRYHSPNNSYRNLCTAGSTWIYQSFYSFGGQYYNLSYWIYLDYIGGSSNSTNVWMNTTIY
ncbi:hypothetical protein I4U23_015935 [Adineta vaga]|nr:hypothetical protein I4U23_015935 [Adineta vaga]